VRIPSHISIACFASFYQVENTLIDVELLRPEIEFRQEAMIAAVVFKLYTKQTLEHCKKLADFTGEPW
jgi:hypothetical protein